MTDKVYWVALAMTPGVGPRTFAALVERFGSPRAVFSASPVELGAVARVTAELAAQLRAADMDAIENDLYALGEDGVTVLTRDDEAYPANLRQIADAPPVLFVRGAVREQDAWSVAIVGTREPTEWGAGVAGALARGFAERGVTVVSGLARGIDAAAHAGALDGDGRTVGVLGSGIRVIHPQSNRALAERMVHANGAILSEFAPNASPQGATLMARDRVISGLARAVIVVQAAVKSGSLDTAARARRQKRGVWAVRGGGPGTEDLIARGARVIDAEAVDWEGLLAALETHGVDAPFLPERGEPSAPAGRQMPLL